MAKDWQTIQIPLASGLSLKADPRALQPPALDLARDVQFDETGGLQTRLPFASSTETAIFGGGNIANARQCVQNGDEKLLFTNNTLYSWNAQLAKWVSKGTHLAVKVDEQPRFQTTSDQIDGDRAELGGTIVFAWVDAGQVYCAAMDKATGSVLTGPTAITNATGRPRLVACSTKILLFNTEGALFRLVARAIDPTVPATGFASAPTVVDTGLTADDRYDVTRVIGLDKAVLAWRLAVTTSYTVGTVTAALAVAKSVKARACDGSVAVSSTPDGVSVQVARGHATALEGDLITISTLVDVYTAQAIGAIVNTSEQITCAHRSVQNSGQYRCYVFWTSGGVTADGSVDRVVSNWVDTGNTLGSAATLISRVDLASRAFDFDGSVYFWGVFSGASGFSGASAPGFRSALQNSYLLYRDDAFLSAKSAMNRAGGNPPTTGRLPGVALTSGTTAFSWCGTEHRVIPLGANQSGYAERGPRDITFTFDSNEARRCARLGNTLYVACGEGLLQYDGVSLYETGFHVFPWFFAILDLGVGVIPDGTYAYKVTWSARNARGELDRSTTATIGTVDLTGGTNEMTITSWFGLPVTHRTAVTVEVWRTAINPTPDSPFFLITSLDPSVTSNPNRYVANVNALPTFVDNATDAVATAAEANPENGSVLENLPPPPCSIIHATHDRLFIAGIAGDPDRVWYSKQRNDGEAVSFHDALTIDIPREGGKITAIGFLNETLVVWRQYATYVVPGSGLNNLGEGQGFAPARIVSSDCGAISMETVALTPAGLIYKSSKGWYLLPPSWQPVYIGGPVSDFDSDTITAVHVLESQHQIRCLSASRMLVLDYLVNQWAEWTISDGLHACIWQGTYTYLAATGTKPEQTTYATVNYGMDVETAWIKLNDLQGAGRVRWFLIAGEYRGSHHLRIRVARDYLQDGAGNWVYHDDKYWTPSPTTIGSVLQVRHGSSVQRYEAIKVRITASETGNDGTPATSEALKLTGLALEVGINKGLYRRLPAAQKVGA